MESKSEFISFVDGDDSIEPTFLEELIALADHHREADYIASGVVMLSGAPGPSCRSQTFTMPNRASSVRLLLEGLEVDYELICISGPWSKLFRRSLIEAHGLRFNEFLSLGEDALFNIDYLAHANAVATSSSALYRYHRERVDSLFTQFNEDMFQVSEFVYDRLRLLMISKGCGVDSIMRFERMYFSLLVECVRGAHRVRAPKNKSLKRTYVANLARNGHIREYLRGNIPVEPRYRVLRRPILRRSIVLLDAYFRCEASRAALRRSLRR